MNDNEHWHVIPVPCTLSLTGIAKERGTHGSVYCLWDNNTLNTIWIGQSVPALVENINSKAVFHESKRLHASSLYRCLRKEARKESHKSWKITKFNRSDLNEINQFVKNFPKMILYAQEHPLKR